jgi:hypothetical protein
VNFRKIVSLTSLISFLFLIATSLVLYIVPQGRVAYWSEWRLFGLSKTDWTNIHINLGLLLLLSIALHIYYNWKPIVAYLKNKARQITVFTPNFNVAAAVVFAFVVGTYFLIPPFSWVLGLSSAIKDAAALKYGEPPYGHAELSTLKSFASRMNLDLTRSMDSLQTAGIRLSGADQTLLEIAKANRLTPQQVYLAMKPEEAAVQIGQPMPEQPPPGTGRRTLADLCGEYDLHIPKILSGLAAEKIQASAEMTLKDIAANAGRNPTDLYELIRQAAYADESAL